ncbi:MAG: outer membrane protein transport protein [Thiotrichaceae bacterium]
MSKRLLLSSLSLSLLISHSALQAAGFAIIENSASGMGNAFAGAAAVGEDASTVWFNPAAMSRLGDRPSVSQSAHVIIPTASFSDRGSSVNPALTQGNTDAAVAALAGQPNDSADKVALVPNLYYVRPINEKMHFGIGVNAPFGLEVTYKDDWIGRYLATNSEMLSININPALSWKANDRLSFGGGVSLQYVDVTLGSKIDSTAACLSAATAANSTALLNQCRNPALPTPLTLGNSATDSNAEITGDDISYGFNLGVLFEPTDRTRIGASYRSKINHTLKGKADFEINDSLAQIFVAAPTAANPAGVTLQQALQAPGQRLESRNVSAEANLPDSFSLSVAHKLNSKFELLADATWTGWSSFEELRVVDNIGVDVALTPEKWEDVWRLSIGGNYKYNDKITLRSGVAFDESPIPTPALRTPRIPGNDRTWLSFGAGYKLKEHINIEVGYAHLFVDDTPINHTSSDNGFTIKGLYEADVDILSAQLNYKF